MNEEPAARAVALVERLFALLHECRGLELRNEGAGPDPEPVSAQAERLLYYALAGHRLPFPRGPWPAAPRCPS